MAGLEAMGAVRVSDLPSTGGLSEFADDHEEKHAIGAGAGLGFAAVASGELQSLAIGATIAVQAIERKNRPKPAQGQDIGNDIRREPHYFLGALVLGAALGLVTNPGAAAGVAGVLPGGLPL